MAIVKPDFKLTGFGICGVYSELVAVILGAVDIIFEASRGCPLMLVPRRAAGGFATVPTEEVILLVVKW